MKKLASSLILPALLATTMWSGAAYAQYSGGSEGSGEASRSPMAEDYVLRDAVKPIASPKLEEGEESRAAPVTDEAAVNSMAAVGRSRDGKELRVAPSDALKSIIKEELNAPADAKKTSA